MGKELNILNKMYKTKKIVSNILGDTYSKNMHKKTPNKCDICGKQLYISDDMKYNRVYRDGNYYCQDCVYDKNFKKNRKNKI